MANAKHQEQCRRRLQTIAAQHVWVGQQVSLVHSSSCIGYRTSRSPQQQQPKQNAQAVIHA